MVRVLLASANLPDAPRPIAYVAEEEKAQEQFASGIERLQAASKKATEAQLTGIAAVKAARDNELKTLEETYQETLKQASGDTQRLAAINAYESARTATITQYDQKITAARTAQEAARTKATEAAAAAQKTAVTGYVSAAASAMGGLQSSFGQLLDSIDPEGHKRAYMAIWRAHFSQSKRATLRRSAEA